MIERVYDDDGVYLGCVRTEGRWLVAEDRIAVECGFRDPVQAIKWLRARRALVLGDPGIGCLRAGATR